MGNERFRKLKKQIAELEACFAVHSLPSNPFLRLDQMGRMWHLGKVLFEQWWLSPFGPQREALGLALQLGARMYGVPISA